MAADVKSAVLDVIGRDGDETILDYVIAILEDEHFEFGEEGKDAFDAFGDILVGIKP